MDVILPVAGFGSRLRPHTWSKPKPLVSVAGKPMLQHVLDRVMLAQPHKLVFITGYLGHQIERWARETYPDVELAFVDQPEMLGQSDAILRTRDHVRDDALILFPDMLFEADFSGLRDAGVDGIAFTKEVDDPSAFGIAVLREDRTIERLIEKPSEPVSRLAVMGIYYIRDMAALYAAMDRQIESGKQLKGEYFLADALQIMIDEGRRLITRNVPVWEDCGNSESLLQTNRYLLDNGGAANASATHGAVIQPSFVHADADIEGSVVGPYASVGAGTTIRGSIVRDAIIENDSTLEHVIVEHSVIGSKVTVTGAPKRLDIGDTTKINV